MPNLASGGQVINPAPAEATGPNTSSRPSLLGVGQTHDPTRMGGLQSAVRRFGIPVVMATVLSVVGIVFVLRGGSNDVPPPRITKPAVPKPIVWEIKTEPAGAQVIRNSDDSVLGTTPWRSEQPPSGGKLGLILRHTGYADKNLIIEKDQDFSQEIKLAPAPPAGKTDKPKRPKKPRNVEKKGDFDLLK